jgi:hypothetical protein
LHASYRHQTEKDRVFTTGCLGAGVRYLPMVADGILKKGRLMVGKWVRTPPVSMPACAIRRKILDGTVRLLDFSRPVAGMLMAILQHTDDARRTRLWQP